LTPDGTRALIEFRSLAAGRDPKQAPLFADDSILPIWRETRGYPRSICLLCLHLSLELLDRRVPQVTGALVEEFLEKHQGYRQLEEPSTNE
jgi:type II secretory pathway predicted ATPase ExeA